MALFVLRKLILQTRMRGHPVGLDVWFFIGPFVYFHTSCVGTAKALARLRGSAGSPEPSLVTYVISTIITWAGLFNGAVDLNYKGNNKSNIKMTPVSLYKMTCLPIWFSCVSEIEMKTQCELILKTQNLHRMIYDYAKHFILTKIVTTEHTKTI